jgi:hypothetical protein
VLSGTFFCFCPLNPNYLLSLHQQNERVEVSGPARGVESKGNQVKLLDSTRCCNSPQTHRAASCHWLQRLWLHHHREGASAMGEKSEDLPSHGQ